MTTLREAATQALEAMSSFESGTGGLYEGEFSAEIAALKAALAEPTVPSDCTDSHQPVNEPCNKSCAPGYCYCECPHGVTDGNCKECFAALVAAAERERIIAENAPVIEKINAHIKALEDELAAIRARSNT